MLYQGVGRLSGKGEARMLKNEKMAQRRSIQLIQERYEYWEYIPKRGLVIDGKPAITQVNPELVGDYLIYTVRDPLAVYGTDPAELIAERLREPVLAGRSGLFTTYTGYYKGARVSVCSGGSGCPEVELAINDFMRCTDCSTFIRVGVSGGVAEAVKVGDFVISSGIFREDGTSRAYVADGFPACCHYEVVSAMIEAAEILGKRYHLGITACMDSDYVGNGRPSIGGYLQPENIQKLGTYNRAGVLNTDRESSIMVTMCNLFERRGGTVFCITDNIISGEAFKEGAGSDESIEIALEGIALLHQMDARKLTYNKQYWHPSIGLK